jgi:hypothetical protein
MPANKDGTTRLDRILGLDQPITRQDFLNSALLASGVMLAGKSPLDLITEDNWTGYGGVGDYSNSNGNTYQVVTDGHKIRDGLFSTTPQDVVQTGEEYDCIVVGGGISGMAAALFLQRAAAPGTVRILILDNHPIFGGEPNVTSSWWTVNASSRIKARLCAFRPCQTRFWPASTSPSASIGINSNIKTGRARIQSCP